jgi:hypothetical protein
VKLQDAMAEVIFQDILKHPKKYPALLVHHATKAASYDWSQYHYPIATRHRLSMTWGTFKDCLKKHTNRLPALLDCTEPDNGV